MRLLLMFADVVNVETPTTAFLKAGILGACIVVLAGVVVYLYRDGKSEVEKREVQIRTYLEQIGRLQQQHVVDLAALQKQRTDEQLALQAQRVADAQQVAERLLRVNEQTVTALTNVSSAMEAQREAMNELKLSFKELGDEIRRNAPTFRSR